jgi:hypothetical protein
VYFIFDVGLILIFILAIILVIEYANSTQNKHVILRNFSVLGYFRYLFEMISLEIQQYFIERPTDGKPLSRNERSLAY